MRNPKPNFAQQLRAGTSDKRGRVLPRAGACLRVPGALTRACVQARAGAGVGVGGGRCGGVRASACAAAWVPAWACVRRPVGAQAQACTGPPASVRAGRRVTLGTRPGGRHLFCWAVRYLYYRGTGTANAGGSVAGPRGLASPSILPLGSDDAQGLGRGFLASIERAE